MFSHDLRVCPTLPAFYRVRMARIHALYFRLADEASRAKSYISRPQDINNIAFQCEWKVDTSHPCQYGSERPRLGAWGNILYLMCKTACCRPIKFQLGDRYWALTLPPIAFHISGVLQLPSSRPPMSICQKKIGDPLGKSLHHHVPQSVGEDQVEIWTASLLS